MAERSVVVLRLRCSAMQISLGVAVVFRMLADETADLRMSSASVGMARDKKCDSKVSSRIQ